jgi:hypothetical protein
MVLIQAVVVDQFLNEWFEAKPDARRPALERLKAASAP